MFTGLVAVALGSACDPESDEGGVPAQGRVVGVRTELELVECDAVVAGADYHHVEQNLLAHEQIVAFMWTNDAVGDIESYVDVDAVRLSETHDYTPMFSSDVDDHTERSAIRDDFIDGVERWVGERY